MKTVKQLLFFIIPTVIIWVLFFFMIENSAKSFPVFMGTRNYILLFIKDPLFLQAIFNSFVLSEIVIAAALVLALFLYLTIRKVDYKIKLILGFLLTAIAVLYVFIVYFKGYLPGTSQTLLLSKNIFIWVTIINAITMFLGAFGALLLIGIKKELLQKKAVQYGGVVLATLFVYWNQQASTALVGFPATSYSVKTITMHITDYAPVASGINLPVLFIWLQIAVFNCFLFWLAEKIAAKVKNRVSHDSLAG